ncbi:hypothetical protein PRZ48_008882 [Zasmidium cellare]|uniref:Uncharacterized protein n=1 Tax=Zasmidium cellare TaxID=395010 RepID=A0ABR0EHZ3_ZASCE|nr:hypothetical protein PRZ48_008882 [Zasmidium cellare]
MENWATKGKRPRGDRSMTIYGRLRRDWLWCMRKKLRDAKHRAGRRQAPQKSSEIVHYAPDSYHPTACSQALRLPELSWMVMDHLDGMDLCNAVAAGGQFHAIVQGSSTLRRELSLEHTVDGSAFEPNRFLFECWGSEYLEFLQSFGIERWGSAGANHHWPGLGLLPRMNLQAKPDEPVIHLQIDDCNKIPAALKSKVLALQMYLGSQARDIHLTIKNRRRQLEWLLPRLDPAHDGNLVWDQAELTIRSCTLGRIFRIAQCLHKCADAGTELHNSGHLDDFNYKLMNFDWESVPWEDELGLEDDVQWKDYFLPEDRTNGFI